MMHSSLLSLSLCTLLTAGLAAGCADKKPAEGPMEHAGKKVDDAARDTKEAAKGAAQDTKEAGKDVREDVKKND